MRTTDTGYLAAFSLAVLPFFTLPGLFYSGINSKFFLVIALTDALILMAAYRLYRTGAGHVRIGKRWFLAAILGVLLTQVLAALTGLYPARSFWSDIFWSSGVIYLAHLALLMVILGEMLSTRDWHLVRRTVLFSATAFSILSILGVGGMGLFERFLWIDLGNTGLSLGNETYAGAYLVLAFMIGLIELIRTGAGRMRTWLIAALVAVALSPLLVGYGAFNGNGGIASVLGSARASSAALFALLIFLAGYLAAARFLPRTWGARAGLIWGGVLILGAVVAIGMLFTPGSRVQEAYIAQSTAARIIVWEKSEEAIGERPFLGWGPENFNYAMERHFDPTLFDRKNLGEIWFERGHNVFIDTLVGSGAVGALAFLLLIVAYLLVAYRARERGLVSGAESAILFALPFVHLLQLQTGFDTIASYVLLAVVGAYLLSLERETAHEDLGVTMGKQGRTVLALGLTTLALLSLVMVLGAEYRRQSALFASFNPKDAGGQRAALAASLTRTSSFESLRLSSSSFIKGSLLTLTKEPSQELKGRILEVARIYDERYQAYIAAAPDHYRARLNYVYLLLFMTALGEDRLTDALTLIEGSYALSPGNPLTPVFHSVVLLYAKDPEGAKRLMDETVAKNPDTNFMRGVSDYLDRQLASYPNLTLITVTNL